MKVGQVCTQGAVSVSRSAPLSEVAQLMYDHSIGAVILTSPSGDQPVVVGILTDRDIVRAQLERVADLSRIQAGDIMTRDPLVLSAQDSVENAIRHLRARGVRRAPVIAANGALVGMVSTDDLLGHVAAELASLAHLVSRQRNRERAPHSQT